MTMRLLVAMSMVVAPGRCETVTGVRAGSGGIECVVAAERDQRLRLGGGGSGFPKAAVLVPDQEQDSWVQLTRRGATRMGA
jgi:hypothetical protein